MSRRRIRLVEGLLEPLPFEVLAKLNQNSHVGFSWLEYKTVRGAEKTVYGALLSAAERFCHAAHLSDTSAAEDAVTRTCIEVCAISKRDGRARSTDKRTRSDKPTFYNIESGWVQYAGWVMGRLKFIVKRMQREQMEQVQRMPLHPEDVSHLELSRDIAESE
jgi:hypothetical protein